jgi:GTPase
VLRDLGIDPDKVETRMLEVWNKVDKLSDEQRDVLLLDAQRRELPPVLVSAVTGEGVDALRATINRLLGANDDELTFALEPVHGKLVHWLHEHTEVVERIDAEDGQMRFRVRVTPDKRGRLDHQLRAAGVITQV